MNNNGLIKAALAATLIAFIAIFIGDVVSRLALSPPWDFYLAAGLTIGAITLVIYGFQRNR